MKTRGIVVSTTEQLQELDDEWVALILTAKRVGMTPEEVREFLFNNNKGMPPNKR